jgi:hypothetical protein
MMSTAMADRRDTAGAYAGDGDTAVPGEAGWLSLAAAPTFAVMALLTGASGDGASEMLCSAAQHASPLSGMVPMYLLMSAFHAAPWLKLFATAAAVGRKGSRD